MEELEEFLSLEHARGTYDSSAAFTMVASQALSKMSRHLLRSDTEGVLKLVQGCIGFNASELWIVSGPRQLAVFCSSTEPPASITEMLERFEPIALGTFPSGQQDLILGLCHFLRKTPTLAAISCWQNGQLNGWHALHGDREPQQIRRPPKPVREGFGLHIEFADQALDIAADEIATRCFYAPVTLHLNGKIQGLHPESPFRTVRRGPGPVETLLEFHDVGGDPKWGRLGPRPKFPSDRDLTARLNWPLTDEQRGMVTTHALFRCLGRPKQEFNEVAIPATASNVMEALVLAQHFRTDFRATASLFIELETRVQNFETLIYPVKRGVFLEPVSVYLPAPPCVAILPADSLATDLSQFTLLESELADLCERACLLIEQGLELLCKFKCVPTPQSEPDLVRCLGVSAATVFVLLFATTTPISVLLGALTGVGLEAALKYRDEARRAPIEQAEALARYHQVLENLRHRHTAATNGDITRR